MKLRYTMTGTGAGNILFISTGEVEGHNPLDPEAHQRACMAAFQQVTSGKATFGQPGKGGCRGPYKVSRMVIEEVPSV